ncbi:hypothetical protein ACFL4R_01230 [Nitrospirota bacterium]
MSDKSFEIYLVRPNLSPLTGGEIRNYFRGRRNMAIEKEGAGLSVTYRNPLTSASFVFAYNSDGLKHAAERPGEAFQSVQLSCAIDYLRPSFYAYEASVEIEKLTTELSLSALSPHSRKSPDTPDMFVAPEMLRDWQEANRAAISEELSNGGKVSAVSPRYTGMLWKYLIVRKRMEEKVGEGVQVPDMVVMRAGGGTSARTMVKWDDAAPMALPPCQSVLIHRVRRKGIFGIGRKVEDGIANYEDALSTMKPFMQEVALDKPRYSLPVLMPDMAKKAHKAFRQIPLNPLPEGLEPVKDNAFVDVLPSVKG